MRIIDKYTDYYDHYGNIYGQDPEIVFDRRGAVGNTGELLSDWLNTTSLYPMLLLLETGYTQHLFRYSDIKTASTRVNGILNTVVTSYTVELIKTYREQRHRFPAAMTIAPMHIHWSHKYRYLYSTGDLKKVPLDLLCLIREDYVIPLPILKPLGVSKVLEGAEIWKDMFTYLSAQRTEKDVQISNSDIDKLINHGFNKKTSFRHPVK